jgi:hypothetical protein
LPGGNAFTKKGYVEAQLSLIYALSVPTVLVEFPSSQKCQIPPKCPDFM